MSATVKFATRWLALMALTAALAWVGLASGRGAGHVPAIWWANAALASAMLLDREKRWLPVLLAGYLGNVTAHVLFHDPLWEVLLLSACDTGETAIAVYGVGSVLGRRADLTRQRQLLRFVLFAVLLGPAAASCAATIFLHLGQGSSFGVPLAWYPASALGMCIVVPLVLGLARRETRELFSSARVASTLLYLLTIAAITIAIFSTSSFAWLFFIFPPLLFLVVRMGLSGGVLGCYVIAAIGTHFTVSAQRGPLAQMANASLENRILILQLFLATAVLSVSVVAIVFAELRRAHAATAASEERYRRLASSMETLATIDALTGVANRRHFDRTLAAEWERARNEGEPLTMLLLDVDHFKAFNDLYGHLEGDGCLRMIARIAQESSRQACDTVARLGGEEFAVLLPRTSAEGAREIAERLRNAVMELGMRHADSTHGVVTVSIGCATVVPDGKGEATAVVAAADAALYEAKKAGRNRVAMA